jgi:hypothetical protein
MTATFRLGIEGQTLDFDMPVRYRWVDPTRGEQTKALVVVPPVSLTMKDPVYLSLNGGNTDVTVTVTATRPGVQGTVRLDLPPGWSSAPAAHDVTWDSTLSEKRLIFRVTPGPGAADGMVGAMMDGSGTIYRNTVLTVSYPHIEAQTFLERAESRLLRLDLNKAGTRLAYIAGSGDDIPPLLERIGYQVTLLSDDDIERGDLGRFDAIIAGVRAYNTREILRGSNDRLLDYVAHGGRYIVQYVTRQRLPASGIGPYPFTISNARVSVETATVSFPDSGHGILRYPNAISSKDFDGWVQERGLYFAGDWDPRYQTMLACNDPGEGLQRGGLLYAPFGKGYFIYTGYAWFRQLPAGVPGAFRLFVNMISQPGSTGRSDR